MEGERTARPGCGDGHTGHLGCVRPLIEQSREQSREMLKTYPTTQPGINALSNRPATHQHNAQHSTARIQFILVAPYIVPVPRVGIGAVHAEIFVVPVFQSRKFGQRMLAFGDLRSALVYEHQSSWEDTHHPSLRKRDGKADQHTRTTHRHRKTRHAYPCSTKLSAL